MRDIKASELKEGDKLVVPGLSYNVIVFNVFPAEDKIMVQGITPCLFIGAFKPDQIVQVE